MEYIQNTEVSPYVSKGMCKVCYVGQEANRNGTVITKEVATEMGRKLPGSPVVGYFDKETEDFRGHERDIVVEDGGWDLVDITKPYGFVPTNANVWFQKFVDDGVEHEYLVTEVYIWTGVYPESQRVIESGNNQSMELGKTEGFWTNDSNTSRRVFILNEALIKKLCILGEQVEPCFEGAQIGKTFSLEDDKEFQAFKTKVYSFMQQLQDILDKGGSQAPMEMEDKKLNPEFAENKPEEEQTNPPAPQEEEKEEEFVEKKRQCSLEEFEALQQKYDTLEQEYSNLMQEKNTLESAKTALEGEIETLKEFKLIAERKEKQQMIDSFYMLSDNDKKEVTDNIDNYTVDEIEAKLAVFCLRNHINFGNEQQQEEQKPEDKLTTMFSLDNGNQDSAPDWIKAVRNTANEQ